MTGNRKIETKMDIVNEIDWRREGIDEARDMVQSILAEDMDPGRLLAVFHLLDGAIRAYRQLSHDLMEQPGSEIEPAA